MELIYLLVGLIIGYFFKTDEIKVAATKKAANKIKKKIRRGKPASTMYQTNGESEASTLKEIIVDPIRQ